MELLLILWLSCGVINYFVIRSKGYPNSVCLTYGVCGFLFGFIGLIFALCKESFVNDPMVTIEELGKMVQMKEQGTLPEAEFEVKKAELLRRI